eukprot:346601_1
MQPTQLVIILVIGISATILICGCAISCCWIRKRKQQKDKIKEEANFESTITRTSINGKKHQLKVNVSVSPRSAASDGNTTVHVQILKPSTKPSTNADVKTPSVVMTPMSAT